MSKKKIEVAEDDMKKIIFMLKLSKEFINIPADNLFLANLWRVAPKLGDKLMRTAGWVMTETKGRLSLKPPVEKPDEVTKTVTLPEVTPIVEINSELPQNVEEAPQSTSSELQEVTKEDDSQKEDSNELPFSDDEPKKTFRCRKRKK